MMSKDLCFLSITEAARLLADRDVSPVELTEAVLGRIKSSKAFRSAFIDVMADGALADAKRAEREIAGGDRTGPLHGIPVALKDIFDVAGLPTTAGSKLWEPPAARANSEVATRFLLAGCVLIGKTNLHEFAYGGTNINPHYGTPTNPWDSARVPGGSSGGSASAVALGMAFAAMGSDTGGSIRGPASYCGVTGLKPSFGLISRRGVVPVSMTLDHVGPMARSALDCAMVLDAIAGYDPADPYSANVPAGGYTRAIDAGVAGLRIGVPTNPLFRGLEPDVERAVRSAVQILEDLGARIIDLEAPWMDNTGGTITRTEFAWYHRKRLADPGLRKRFDQGTLTRQWRGPEPSAGDYFADLQRKAELTRRASSLMQEVDLIANPSTPRTAPTLAEAETPDFLKGHSFIGTIFNYASQPSISIPCGFAADGQPVGLMLSGARWNDALVLRAAHAFQQATDWHTRRPPM